MTDGFDACVKEKSSKIKAFDALTVNFPFSQKSERNLKGFAYEKVEYKEIGFLLSKRQILLGGMPESPRKQGYSGS